MTASTAEVVAPWLEDAELDGGMIIKLAAAAETAAEELHARRRSNGAVPIALEPGNGHRYVIVLAQLTEPWLPGDLLVALPDFHKSALFAATGFHVPGYVEDKLGLGRQHSTVLAVFLTLLGDLLARP